jgi:hypothetical protein
VCFFCSYDKIVSLQYVIYVLLFTKKSKWSLQPKACIGGEDAPHSNYHDGNIVSFKGDKTYILIKGWRE